MKIKQLSIENFRGIRKATVLFGTRTLFVGDNNIGKTTILEALDLVLGPDRLRGPEVLNEHDFYGSLYYCDPQTEQDPETALEEPKAEDKTEADPGSEASPPEIRLEVILGELSEDEQGRFPGVLEVWDQESKSIREADFGEDVPLEKWVLRIGLRGWFDEDEDEFNAESFFSSAAGQDERKRSVSRRDKQAIGFLYLRSLRTGRRAASLQRGSLLDILLGLKNARPKVWRRLLGSLATLGVSLEEDEDFKAVMTGLQERLGKLWPRSRPVPPKGRLHVSQLTREHLRNFMAYFLETYSGDHEVPHERLGAGSTNLLVLALLSIIADVKANVIFAMEEPEIAVSPHTQRRIVRELFKDAQQVIVTSHSPYVAELFLDETIVVLKRSLDDSFSAHDVPIELDFKKKFLKKDFRLRYAEGLFGRAVLVVEGETEQWALPAASDVLAFASKGFLGLDLLGVIVVNGHNNSDMYKPLSFFQKAGIRTYSLIDDTKKEEDTVKAKQYSDVVFPLGYTGFEQVLAKEVSWDALKRFVVSVESRDDYPTESISTSHATEEECRNFVYRLLKARKGEGYAALLVEALAPDELPPTLVRILLTIYHDVSGAKLGAEDPLAGVARIAGPNFVKEEEKAQEPADDQAEV